MVRGIILMFTKILKYFGFFSFLLVSCSNNQQNLSSSNQFIDRTYYTVQFDSMGGSAVLSQQVLEGNPVVRPDAPTKDGVRFSGWYKDIEYVDDWNFNIDRVYENLTLYAKWENINSELPTESLTYSFDEATNTYTVTGVGEETHIVIPETYNGYPVTKIQKEYGRGAFARTDIVSIIIPDSIIEIGQNTFNNCTQLVDVQISENSQLEIIGRNAFSGCSSLSSIYLPKTVTQILDSAFNNCGAMQEFIVAEENEIYSSENGHLIEKESHALIRGVNHTHIPDGIQILSEASFRRVNTIEMIYVPLSVQEIQNYWIADSTITSIYYEGTEIQWENIIKTEMWNYGNREVQVYFNQ